MSNRFFLVEGRFGTGIVDRSGEGTTKDRPTVIIRDTRFAETMARCLDARARRCRCGEAA